MLQQRLPVEPGPSEPTGGGTFWCRDIHRELRLPYPPALVWRGVSERAVLAGWFMDNDLVPEVGHPFTFRKNPQRGWDGITWCELIELNPQQTIAMRYRGRASGEKALACAGVDSKAIQSTGKNVFTELDTILRFSVLPDGEGSRLVLDHTGFQGFSQVIVSFIMGAGWGKVLRRLPAALDAAARGEVLAPVR